MYLQLKGEGMLIEMGGYSKDYKGRICIPPGDLSLEYNTFGEWA